MNKTADVREGPLIRTGNKSKQGRVAYLLPTSPSISETFVVREIEAVASSGIEVSLFALRRSTDPYIGPRDSDRSVFERCIFARPDNLLRHLVVNLQSLLSHPGRYLSTLRIFLRKYRDFDPVTATAGLYHFFCGIGFSKELVDQGIRQIHAHFATGSDMALAASNFSGIPFSFTAHASGDIFVKPFLVEEKVRSARSVFPVCDYSKKYLDSITGYRYSRKLHRIYNGVMPDECAFSSDAAGEGGDAKAGKPLRVVSVGRLVNCKGFCTLLEACRIVTGRGHSITCEIIGEGPDRDVLAALTKEWRMEQVVTLSGAMPLSEIYRRLSGSDIFVLLSEIHVNGYRDGFPTVILEAMLMSLPVVSTWVSGIPEMVLHGKTGLLVHERDAEAAADAIEKLLLDQKMRREFGAAARERVLEEFNAEKTTRALCSFLCGGVDGG